jgi:hypothetical protein
LRPTAPFVFLLATLLLGLEATRGVRVAEAVHVDGLDADASAAIATGTTANIVASICFTVAPFVDGKILTTHGGRLQLM